MSSYYPLKRKAPEAYTTEFDILKASHKFLRGDEDEAKSWDAQLAKKYEDSLFKEFAVCDLKHYKSGNVALRWRTEDEVVSGAGEETCGNTRCPYYDALDKSTSSRSHDASPKPPRPPKLTTMELPFSYVENGETERREVMVKVVLCERCVKKLTWKRRKDKKERHGTDIEDNRPPREEPRKSASKRSDERADRRRKDRGDGARDTKHKKDGSRSRSRSPRRESEGRIHSRGR